LFFYAKPPFDGAEQVLNYQARYTHLGRDYAHGGKKKVMTVSSDEFLRRFLIHVLPKGLVRIRHFGLLANRRRSAMLTRCT